MPKNNLPLPSDITKMEGEDLQDVRRLAGLLRAKPARTLDLADLRRRLKWLDWVQYVALNADHPVLKNEARQLTEKVAAMIQLVLERPGVISGQTRPEFEPMLKQLQTSHGLTPQHLQQVALNNRM